MSESIKPVKYYICMDSTVQKEQVQIKFENIKNKVRLSNGKILDEALRMYWKSVSGKR